MDSLRIIAKTLILHWMKNLGFSECQLNPNSAIHGTISRWFFYNFTKPRYCTNGVQSRENPRTKMIRSIFRIYCEMWIYTYKLFLKDCSCYTTCRNFGYNCLIVYIYTYIHISLLTHMNTLKNLPLNRDYSSDAKCPFCEEKYIQSFLFLV